MDTYMSSSSSSLSSSSSTSSIESLYQPQDDPWDQGECEFIEHLHIPQNSITLNIVFFLLFFVFVLRSVKVISVE